MDRKLKYVINNLYDKSIFNIIDIKGFDLYSGLYAKVRIFNSVYKIWIGEGYDGLIIEDFPIDTTNGYYDYPALVGSEDKIINIINDISKFGGDIDLYKDSQKYNI